MAKLAFLKQRNKKDSSANGGSVQDKQDLHDRGARIAARAFQLFQQRGWTHGYDVQDWLQAEKDLYGSTT